MYVSSFVAYVRENIYHKALLMGYSVRLELTGICSLNDFQLVRGLYRGPPLFFLECDLPLSGLPLIDIWCFLSLCVCVCVGVVLDFTHSYFSSVWVCVLEILCVYVCVCVW